MFVWFWQNKLQVVRGKKCFKTRTTHSSPYHLFSLERDSYIPSRLINTGDYKPAHSQPAAFHPAPRLPDILWCGVAVVTGGYTVYFTRRLPRLPATLHAEQLWWVCVCKWAAHEQFYWALKLHWANQHPGKTLLSPELTLPPCMQTGFMLKREGDREEERQETSEGRGGGAALVALVLCINTFYTWCLYIYRMCIVLNSCHKTFFPPHIHILTTAAEKCTTNRLPWLNDLLFYCLCTMLTATSAQGGIGTFRDPWDGSRKSTVKTQNAVGGFFLILRSWSHVGLVDMQPESQETCSFLSADHERVGGILSKLPISQ